MCSVSMMRHTVDCLKIGEATCEDENVFGLSPNSKVLNEAARKRINQYTQTAGIAYDLLYTELTVYNRGGLRSFNDKEVHNVLERSGIKKKVFDTVNKANEWFITDLETVKRAIAAVKAGRSSLSSAEVTREYSPIVFRPEQQEAISKTKKQFKKGNQMLWNAKMRFGKDPFCPAGCQGHGVSAYPDSDPSSCGGCRMV